MNSRLIYTGMFLVCSGLIGFGLYLQHAQGLEPCPMCILQRYAFVAIGVIALAAAVHNPATKARWSYWNPGIFVRMNKSGMILRNSNYIMQL